MNRVRCSLQSSARVSRPRRHLGPQVSRLALIGDLRSRWGAWSGDPPQQRAKFDNEMHLPGENVVPNTSNGWKGSWTNLKIFQKERWRLRMGL